MSVAMCSNFTMLCAAIFIMSIMALIPLKLSSVLILCLQH